MSDISASDKSHFPPTNSKEELSYLGIIAMDDATGQSFTEIVTVTVSPAFASGTDEMTTDAGSLANTENAPNSTKNTLSSTIETIFFNISTSSPLLFSEAGKCQAIMYI